MNKSLIAAFLISLGVAVNLTIGSPLGPIFFAFGLLGVCVLDAELYTGKAGYWWKDKKMKLLAVLFSNIIWGWFFGMLISYANPELVAVATAKITAWNFSLQFFLQSFFCGSIMYICVDSYKKGNVYAIFLGVPLFIYCGFQHSIANAIVYGVAQTIPNIPLILFCAFGNLCGALIVNLLMENDMGDAYKERCRCVRDLKLVIPEAIWRQAEQLNPTKDNWRTACIGVQLLRDYYNRREE